MPGSLFDILPPVSPGRPLPTRPALISSADCPSAPRLFEIQKPGFRALRSEIELNVGETKTLNYSLEIAGVDTTVEVVAETELVRNSAAVGATFDNTQLSQLPINGRNWGGLMTLTPGAIDTGAGNGASVRFFGQGGDDNNFRIDGVDATSVRNQAESKSRLMISEDAIAEFRVNSQESRRDAPHSAIQVHPLR
jgi:hypothetical protein